MKKFSRSGWRRIMDAAGFSTKGMKAAWKHEAAFRQELFLVAVLLPAALLIGETATQKALLIFSLLQVIIVELLNSAIETVVDRIGTDHNELSGRAKDLGSAAVMASLVTAGAVWAVIIWH